MQPGQRWLLMSVIVANTPVKEERNGMAKV